VKLKPFILALLVCSSQTGAIASESRTKFEKYLVFADRDKYNEALLLINALVKSSPKDEWYLAERARVCMNLRKYQEAIDDANKTLAINPKNGSALRTRSYCYLMMQKYPQGIKDLELLVKITEPDLINMFPGSDHENLARAYALVGRNDLAKKERELSMLDQLTEQAILARERAGLEKALKLTEQVLKKNPKHFNALAFRGLCYNNLTQFKESIDCLSRAIALKPNCPSLIYLRMDGYRETKQYDKAIADLNRIIALKPRITMFKYASHTGRLRDKFSHEDIDAVNMADIYFLRGSCYDNQKKYELAIKDFNKTLELDPKEYKAATNAANAYSNLRKYDEAVTMYSKALTINPRYWEAYTWRARAYEQLGQPEKAIGDISAILKIHPSDTGAYCLRGNLYRKAKQFDKAIADYSKMTELAPTDDEGFRERADTYALTGKYQAALSDYNKAISLSAEDKEAIAKARDAVRRKMSESKPTK
jgi:tetratricopeptide (TPR) repeat protein